MYFSGRGVSRIARPTGAASVRKLAISNAPSNLLTIHPEVADALAHGAPVVALESTVITHGLVYPHNLKTAISCEENIRANGAIPATIGLLEGRMHVGLERKQLEILADVESLKKAGKSPIKLSRRDIAPAMSLGHCGGTTIAGTTVVAHLAGIKVFATGGLGGVHRGGEAYLTELGRTPIAVVASGAKSILDIGRTLEYLETQGVTVAAYDNNGDWPAFFTARSGYKAPWAFNNPRDAAKAIYYADKLGIQSGTIFGVPIPKEFEKAGLEIQAAVDQAVRESEENGIAKSGRDATPWLLSRVKDITKGLSLPSNIALLENNARVGAQIAVEFARLKESGTQTACSYQPAFRSIKPTESTLSSPVSSQSSPLVIIGAAAMDIIAQPYADNPSAAHSTAPGSVRMSPGGVARNVAEAAHRVLESLSTPDASESLRPLLISPIGRDAFGSVLTLETQLRGMRTDGLLHLASDDERTATCNMFLDARGDLQMGVADMGIIESANLAVEKLLNKMEAVAPKIVAFDGNPSPDTIASIVQKAKDLGAMTFFEPTSTAKCIRIIPALTKMVENNENEPYITGAFPNIIELRSMWETARSEDILLNSSYWWRIVDTFGSDLHRVLAGQVRGDMLFLLNDGIIQMATQLLPFVKNFVIKCGSKGVVLVAHVTSKESAINWISEGSQPRHHQIISRASDGSALVVRHFPAYALPQSLSTINVTGAGDTLVGALLAAMTHKNKIFSSPADISKAIDLGQSFLEYPGLHDMVAPTCPVCTSRKWRKAAGTGELICSEGHVLQGYRNETIEITEMGAHTVHHRQLRTGRRRRGQREENLDVYYGARARYLYYQCRQLVLRHQIDKLISEWGLPEEAKNICRTIWLLALEVLPGKPSPQPWIHAQAEPESTDLNTQGGEERIDEPMKTKKEGPDQSSGSESSDDEVNGADARIDREIEKLMYEASDTESDPGSKERDAAKTERVNNRNARHCLYDSAATNIAILVLTCWWLRIPVTYLDFINLINAYRIPYLDTLPLLSENMRKHLSVALRQELSPPHAPTVAALHVITRRIARRLQATHGVNIPEFNAAPVLWRAVRAFQGPPILYTMGKQLMERLEVPLTIYPSLAPKPSSGKSGFGGDWAPVEVTMAAVLVLVLKLVYGFQKDAEITWEDDDPASYFRDFPSYITALRRGKESKRMEFDSLLSKTNNRTADTLCNEEIDKYLDVAERALGARAMGSIKSMPFRQLTTIYGDIQSSNCYAKNVGSSRKNEVPLEALERPGLGQSVEHKVAKQPGETVVNWSSNDPFGVLPPDYELLIETASIWSGVEQSTVGRLVTLFERRLYRYLPKRREENLDSDMDNEYIDIDQPSQRSGSQEEPSKHNIKYEEDEINEVKVSENGYKLGSKNWRQRVHNKLSANNRSKSAYKQISSEEEGEELESEDSNSKPHSRAKP